MRSSGHIKIWESGFLNWLLFFINHLGMFMVQCRIHAFKHIRFNMKIISLSQNSNCLTIVFHYNKCYTTLHLQNKAQKTWKKFQMFLLIKTNNKTKIFKNLATNFDFLLLFNQRKYDFVFIKFIKIWSITKSITFKILFKNISFIVVHCNIIM